MYLQKIMSVLEFERYVKEMAILTEAELSEVYGEASIQHDLAPYAELLVKHIPMENRFEVMFAMGIQAGLAMVERALQTRELEKSL